MHARLQLGALATALIVALLSPAGSAHAAPKPPAPQPLTTTTTVSVDTFTINGKKTGHVEYPATSSASGAGGGEEAVASGTTMTAATTTSGTSSASGCKKVNVGVHGTTYLGFTAYDFVNSTHWCWTRSTQTVYDVDTSWLIGNVDSQYKWDGIINYTHGFYDYSTNDGHPYSAYKNQRTGHFENCVLSVGCIGDIYPTVLIRSYYNGTYAWDTSS